MRIESGGAQLTVGQPSQPFELCSPMCGHFDRKRELKRCTRHRVGACPQTAAVRFDYRPANRQSHASALRFGRKKGIKNLLSLVWTQPHSSIGNRNDDSTILILL